MPNGPEFTLLTRIYCMSENGKPIVAAEERSNQFPLEKSRNDRVIENCKKQLLRTLSESSKYPQRTEIPEDAVSLPGTALRALADLLDSGKLDKSAVLGRTDPITGRAHLYITLAPT